MDDLEQKIKEKLLEGLIDHMHDRMGEDMGSKFPKKAMEVSVAAPDKKHLAEGLEHAKEIAAGGEHDEHESDDEGSDEERLMALLGGHDGDGDEDEDKVR